MTRAICVFYQYLMCMSNAAKTNPTLYRGDEDKKRTNNNKQSHRATTISPLRGEHGRLPESTGPPQKRVTSLLQMRHEYYANEKTNIK